MYFFSLLDYAVIELLISVTETFTNGVPGGWQLARVTVVSVVYQWLRIISVFLIQIMTLNLPLILNQISNFEQLRGRNNSSIDTVLVISRHLLLFLLL